MKATIVLRSKFRSIRPWTVAAIFVSALFLVIAPDVQAQQSQHVVLDGRLLVQRAVRHPAGAERISIRLETNHGTYPVVATTGTFVEWPNLSAVRLIGTLRNGTLIIGDPNLSLRPSIKTNLPKTSQTFRYAVVMVKFPNTPINPTLTADNINDQLFTASTSSAEFYRQASNGRMAISGDIYNNTSQWYTVAFPPTKFYTNDQTELKPFCDIDALAQEVADATKKTFSLKQYDALMMILPDMSCAVSGLEGVSTIQTPQGKIIMPTTILGGDLKFATHEIGHNLGMDHATYAYCNGQAVLSSSCEYSEYGDPYDVMGGGTNFTPNAVHRELLGWFGRRQISVADHTGDYTITPLELSDPTPKVLKIPAQVSQKGYVHAWYYLEFRKPIGVDDHVPDTLTENNITTGVLVHYYAPYIIRFQDHEFATTLNLGKSILLDFSAQACGVACKRPAAAMHIGMTYTDQRTKTSFTPIAKTDGSITIHVDYRGWPVCDPRISDLSLSSTKAQRKLFCRQAAIGSSKLTSQLSIK